jgi:hypothetical protein
LISLILIFILRSFAQAPSIQWQKSYGGSSYDYGYSIQQTTFDNGYVMLGNTESNDGDISGNHGLDDYVVIKTNSSGVLQWQKSYGGTNYEVGTCIKQTPDGGFILCGIGSSNDGDESGNHGDSDYWIIKINSTGIIQWQNSFGGTAEDNAHYISLTTDGGYIIGGYSSSNDFNVSGNHGLGDYWAVKISSVGAIQWQRSYGGTGAESGGPIKQTLDGGYIICSSTNSNNGDVSVNNGSNDYWLVKLNSLGIIQWQKCFGGSGDDFAKDVIQTSDGGYIVCGSSNSINGDVTDNHGNDDYWILKLNNVGAVQWKRSYGGSLFDFANSILQTTEGGYLISGRSSSVDGDKSSNNGAYDNWLVKITGSGAIEWEKNFGGSIDEDARSVIPTMDGGIIVCGTTTSNDLDVSGNHGGSDLWVVKFYSIVGINSQMPEDGFSFFPNPCKNKLTVKTKFNDEKIAINIIDINGKTIQSLSALSANKQVVFNFDLDNGVYLLKIKDQNNIEVNSKLIIAN